MIWYNHTAKQCKRTKHKAWSPQYQLAWGYIFLHKTVLSSLRNALDPAKEIRRIIDPFQLSPYTIQADVPSAKKVMIESQRNFKKIQQDATTTRVACLNWKTMLYSNNGEKARPPLLTTIPRQRGNKAYVPQTKRNLKRFLLIQWPTLKNATIGEP